MTADEVLEGMRAEVEEHLKWAADTGGTVTFRLGVNRVSKEDAASAAAKVK